VDARLQYDDAYITQPKYNKTISKKTVNIKWVEIQILGSRLISAWLAGSAANGDLVVYK
jgi:hypothetical protein